MKIIAYGIINLTDARYFAAMGVDWIGFNMGQHSPLTIEHVEAFADWIEGPEFFLDVRGRSSDQIAEMLGNFSAAGLLTDQGILLSNFVGKMIVIPSFDDEYGVAPDTIIIEKEQWQKMKKDGLIAEAGEVWLEASNAADYQNLIEQFDDIAGIVLCGGDEKKMGMKSYDDLDDLIDLIRE